MSQLPLRKLTLYKQGIGYFEREGQVEGSLISLVIPRHGINDVLKSLTVIDLAGGQVLGIDYETPADKQNVLNELSVKLADRSGLVDLLSSLRGSHMTLESKEDQRVTGRLVGVEASLDPASHPPVVLLQLETDLAQIQALPLSQVVRLSLHDDRAVTDVGFFLDMNRTEQTRTSLAVRLSAGQHHLEATYLSPSPTWRVSYRLVGDGHGRARLLDWGLFDNNLEEDLEQVQLTLISGRPISFEYNLYKSYIPARPEVSDDPTDLEAAAGNPLLLESLATISHELRTPLATIQGYAQMLGRVDPLSAKQQQMADTIQQSANRMNEMLGNLLQMARLQENRQEEADITPIPLYRAGPLGDLKVASAYLRPVLVGNAEPEFTTYPVETPVSVRRGQSAMVPIINDEVEYQETYVYNGDKMPNHPLVVWQMRNSTAKALEQGPITLIDAGRYLGEGLMRFTGMGDEVHIPYALEFGILVAETSQQGARDLWRVEFDSKERRAIVSRAVITDYIYTLTSNIRRDVTVLIERRDPNQGEYYQMPEPALATAAHTRWPVHLPADSEVSFTVRVRAIHKSYEDVNNWNLAFMEALQAAGLVAGDVGTRLEQLIRVKQQARDAADQVKTWQAQYDQLVSRQEHLRQNLETLKQTDRELEIRNRVLDDLETSENRRRELEQSMAHLSTQIDQFQQQQQALLDEIYDSRAPGEKR